LIYSYSWVCWHSRKRDLDRGNIHETFSFELLLCCSVLQCVAVCRSVLQCVAVHCSVLQCVEVCCSVLRCVSVCRSVLQCVAVRCRVLQCVAVCCSENMHKTFTVCCSVLQCIAECCRGNMHETLSIPSNGVNMFLRLLACMHVYFSGQPLPLDRPLLQAYAAPISNCVLSNIHM